MVSSFPINILKLSDVYTPLFTSGRPRSESISTVQLGRQNKGALATGHQLKNNGKTFMELKLFWDYLLLMDSNSFETQSF